MLNIFLLSFRESFEAWLVVGIIITYLQNKKCNNFVRAVYLGAISGLIFSVILGGAIFNEARGLSGISKDIFEGGMMLLAASLVAYFIVWMNKQNQNIACQIKNKVEEKNTNLGIFVLSFFSVLREGVELTAFVLTKIDTSPISVLLITLVGVCLSAVVAVFIFYAASHYLIKYIFKFLGALLIYFGAEMFSEGLMKFLPLTGEEWEMILALVFALPAIYIFFRNDISTWFEQRKMIKK